MIQNMQPGAIFNFNMKDAQEDIHNLAYTTIVLCVNTVMEEKTGLTLTGGKIKTAEQVATRISKCTVKVFNQAMAINKSFRDRQKNEKLTSPTDAVCQ